MKVSTTILKNLLISTFVLLTQIAPAQTRLSGHVINTNHNPIQKAEVLLRDATNQTILAHRMTNQRGGFTFEIFDSGSFFIEYRSCGFEPMISKIIEIEVPLAATQIDTMMLEKALKQRHFTN